MSDPDIPTLSVQVAINGEWVTIATGKATDFEQSQPFADIIDNARVAIRIVESYHENTYTEVLPEGDDE